MSDTFCMPGVAHECGPYTLGPARYSGGKRIKRITRVKRITRIKRVKRIRKSKKNNRKMSRRK